MKKLLGIALLAAGTIAYSQSHHDEVNHDEVNHRGDREMGFSHEKTTHHFRLAKDGGAIEVTANDPNDTQSRDQIRQREAGYRNKPMRPVPPRQNRYQFPFRTSLASA